MSAPENPALLALQIRRRRARRNRVRWLMPLLLLPVVIIVLVFAGVWPFSSVLAIRDISIMIDGPGAIEASGLLAMLPIVPGSSFLDVDPDAVVAALTANPRVASATIRYAWFQELIITVCERTAVAAVIDPLGEMREVAADGVLLAPAAATPADLPLLTWEGQLWESGWEPGEVCDLHGAPDVLQVLARIQTDGRGLWPSIAEAHLLPDGTAELFWNDAAIVAWTRGSISDLRLHAWAAVMADLSARGEQDAVVDLRYREQIVVRLPQPPESVPQGQS